MSIIIRDITYIHSDKEVLFQHINLTVNQGDKIALTGSNGCGKSTLMRVIAGELPPTSGTITRAENLYYVPQHFGQYNHQTIAQALRIDSKLNALHAILNGDASEQHFTALNDDWNLEERALAALSAWDISSLPLSHPIDGLSGGEKTRIFLAGIELHAPTVVLLDEPTNHLDTSGRERLYDFVRRTSATLLIISHDRTLLNLLPATYELSPNDLTYYGGNYDFFKEQKDLHLSTLQQQLEEKWKAMRLAKKIAREAAERKDKQNIRGEKASIKQGIPHILMGARKNKAENSAQKLNSIHVEKAEKISVEIRSIKDKLPSNEKLKTNFNASTLHSGKILVAAQNVNFSYPTEITQPSVPSFSWQPSLSFELRSGDRLSITGNNGCGKTTLLKLIIGELSPTKGILKRTDFSFIYLDQEYSLICNEHTLLQQAEAFNHRLLPEHELKTILNRYLFPATTWNKSCSLLSGGEKMRLAFCCLMIADNTPDMFILDEPTNNLDIESIEIITASIRDYAGTVLAVSHDKRFLREINCEQELPL